MKSGGRGSVLICDPGGALVGILTERDIVRLLVEKVSLDVPIEQVMVHDPVTLTLGDTVGKAISVMARGGYRGLPILDEAGHPIGMLGASGILEYLVEHFPNVVYTLPPKPHHSAQEREGACFLPVHITCLEKSRRRRADHVNNYRWRAKPRHP